MKPYNHKDRGFTPTPNRDSIKPKRFNNCGFVKTKPPIPVMVWGFTLVEILVVTAIILTLSSIMLANLRSGEIQYAQDRGLHKLSQDFGRAENLSMSAKEFQGEMPAGGYGLYFKIEEKDHYILFADLNGNQQYDSGLDGLVEDIKFEKGTEIANLSASPLTITFISPDPTINIKPVAQTATVTLDNGRKVKINTAGLIEIE